MSGIPYVIKKDNKDNEHVYDLYSLLLQDSIIMIRGEFNDDLADSVVAQLLYLQSSDREKSINMYINSRGGSIDSMFAIYDCMTYIENPIHTIAYGSCASAASFILAAGDKGHRFALKNCEIMIHQLRTVNSGRFSDVRISYKQTEKIHEKLAEYYSLFTGQAVNKIKKDMEKGDFWLAPEEAIKYGLIDLVYDKKN